MKPLDTQNFYELFEIPVDSTPDQIQQAFDLARKTYADGSLASYSLFDEKERKAIMRRIFLAHETLSDEKRRRLYDRDIGVLKEPENARKTAPMADLFSSMDSEPVKPISIREKPRPETLDGSRLREYRESLQIPLQEIAHKTRVNITYFEFLEKERYNSLPPPVYLRGYIKQYASHLGLDPSAVADRILSLVRGDGQSGEGHPS